jgi:hypothetical protein
MAQAAQPRGAAHAGLINPPADSTVMKVLSSTAPVGPNQERYLANGKEVGMRLFELEAGRGDPPHARDYETVGERCCEETAHNCAVSVVECNMVLGITRCGR